MLPGLTPHPRQACYVAQHLENQSHRRRDLLDSLASYDLGLHVERAWRCRAAGVRMLVAHATNLNGEPDALRSPSPAGRGAMARP
jgi:hypothetical protein